MFKEDLDIYFEDFGECCVVDDAEIKAIFDNAMLDVIETDGVYAGYASASPKIMLKTCDAERHDITRGKTIKLKGIAYQVKERTDDGTGVTTLFLRLKD